MMLAETSDYYYNKIAYNEDQKDPSFENEDVPKVAKRMRIIEGRLTSLMVLVCILIFLVSVHLICNFVAKNHLQKENQTKANTQKTHSSQDSCETGWYNGWSQELGCLKFEVEMKSQEDAKAFCEEHNAHLVEVQQPAQLQVLINLMEVLELSLGRGLWWTGGSNLAEDGKWTWRRSGEPIGDWIWGEDQPDDAEGHNFLCFHYQVSYLGSDCYNNATWGRALCQRK